MLRHFSICFLILLIVSPVELKRASSGGNVGRGQSASRGQVASGGGNFNSNNQPRPNNNFQPQQNNFNQQPHNNFNQQPHNNFNQPRPNQFNNNNQGFHGNSNIGPGSRGSSNTFAKALAGGAAGAIGGLLIFEAGKAIIKSASTPYEHNGRNYYWDNNAPNNPNALQCSMPLSKLQQEVAAVEASTTTTVAPIVAPGAAGETTTIGTITTTPALSNTIGNLQFQDGSRPKQIVWSCKRNIEVCCGSDCCAAPNNQVGNAGNGNMNTNPGHSSGGGSFTGILLVVLLVILLSCCCCCFIAYKMCRSAFDCIIPREDKYQEGYQGVAGDGNMQQQQGGYPMQQYDSQGGYPQQQQQQHQQQQSYPNQQGYPPTHGYPQHAYPSQPTY